LVEWRSGLIEIEFTFHLSALGCRLNEAELELWSQQFQVAGFSISSDPDNADLLVFNSCAVTQEAVRKSRKQINRLKRNNPHAKVVVSGCFVSLNEDLRPSQIPARSNAAPGAKTPGHSDNPRTGTHPEGIDLIVSNAEKDELVPLIVNEWFAGMTGHDVQNSPESVAPAFDEDLPRVADSYTTGWHSAVATKATTTNTTNPTQGLKSPTSEIAKPGPALTFSRQRQRAFIKIQDGCRYKCTYCIVTVARGDERSRSIHELVAEVRQLHEQGIQEIVLTGVHVGGYGSDTGESLANLLKALLDDTAIPRIRFASVEPWDLEDQLLAMLLHPRVMPHMHLPVQSGSDRVLQRMARRCKTGDFQSLTNNLRESMPDFNVTTDIIVGFPGETEAEWHDTLRFVENTSFGHIHIFPFSPRQGTHAAKLTNQVPSTPDARSRQRYHGYTPNYIRVYCDSEDSTTSGRSLENLILPTRLNALASDSGGAASIAMLSGRIE